MRAKIIFALLFLASCGRDEVDTHVPIETTALNHPMVDPSADSDDSATELVLTPSNPIDWKYFAAKDFGLRSDRLGDGAFGAIRRGTPSHRGIDFLMPVDTQLSAPCTGTYLSGYESSFGNWLQLICVLPSPTGKGSQLYASMMFAHLNSRASSDGVNWKSISKGAALGRSGRTGNAASTNPHVHFEMTLHKTLSSAKNDLHGAAKPTPAHTTAFTNEFNEACKQKYGFKLGSGKFILSDRIDPFAFMSCFSVQKPTLSTPNSQKLIKWSQLYSATDYDVNIGR